MHRITRCERGVNGCGYRSYRVKWGIVIRFSITPDPKTIAKQAGVSKYAASNTAEGVQIYSTPHKIQTVNEVFTGVGIGHIE